MSAVHDLPIHLQATCLISKLNPFPKNSRTHSDTQIDQIVASITQYGFTNPVLLDEDNTIVAGHGRVMAASKLGMTELPCVILRGLSESQRRAYVIADNKLALNAGWDTDILLSEIQLLKDDEFDVEFTGFSLAELEALTPDIISVGLTEDDSVPDAPVEPITKVGDVWTLGQHRLMCGDSIMIDDVEKLINGEKAELVLTDPPYGISVVKPDGNIGGTRKGKNGYGKKGQYGKEASCGIYEPIIGDDKPFDPSLLLTLAPEQIIFGANNFASKLPDNSHWIVWYKDMPEGTDFSGAELAWTNIDKKAVKTYKFTWAGMTRQGNRKDELAKRVHPTQKPVGLFVNILNDYNPKSVIDLYGGSGTTIIACEKTNRKCFMMELSPNYCDVIVKRWEQFTGKKAVLNEQ